MSRCSERRLAIELAQQKARGAMLRDEAAPLESVNLYLSEWDVWTGQSPEPPALAAPSPLPTATTLRASPRPWWRRLLGLR